MPTFGSLPRRSMGSAPREPAPCSNAPMPVSKPNAPLSSSAEPAWAWSTARRPAGSGVILLRGRKLVHIQIDGDVPGRRRSLQSALAAGHRGAGVSVCAERSLPHHALGHAVRRAHGCIPGGQDWVEGSGEGRGGNRKRDKSDKSGEAHGGRVDGGDLSWWSLKGMLGVI